MACAARTLDGEPCTRAGDPYCPAHAPAQGDELAELGAEEVRRLEAEELAVSPCHACASGRCPRHLEGDGRLARARELTATLALRDAQVAERRELIAELRADGHSMAAIAAALGISRARVYAALGKVADG